jgi:hypothetical protein
MGAVIFMEYEAGKSSTSKIWKWIGVGLFLLLLVVGLNVQGQKAHAADSNDISGSVTGLGANECTYIHEVDGKMVSTPISKISASDLADWSIWSSYKLQYNYKIATGTNVKNGSTAQVNLPAGTTFSQALDFPITASDGTVIGEFSAPANGTFGHITFTNNYYQTHNNDMTGTINIDVRGSNTKGEHSGGDLGKTGGPSLETLWENNMGWMVNAINTLSGIPESIVIIRPLQNRR